MASDGKQPGTNFASGGVVMAALVAAGTSYFVSHEAPLQGLRPAMTEPQFHQAASSQDIEARLWQDPFAAVAKTIEKAEPGKSERCGENSDSASRARTNVALRLAVGQGGRCDARKNTGGSRHNARSPLRGGWRSPAAYPLRRVEQS